MTTPIVAAGIADAVASSTTVPAAAAPSSSAPRRRKGAARDAQAGMGAWSRRMLIGAVFILILAIWQAAVSFLDVSPLIFPAPAGVIVSLVNGLASGEILQHLMVTLVEILAGFVIGSALGFMLGALIGQSAVLEAVIYPYVVAFQTMPKVAVAPLFVIWFGFGMMSKVVITATIVFFPVVVNTIVGLRSVPRDQLDLMTVCMASRWQGFRMVSLPHALPFIFAGLDIGIVLAVIGAIVGEFVGAQAGLGYLILQRNFSMDTSGVFAILIVLSLIGIGLHTAVHRLSRRMIFWTDTSVDLSRAS
jgi:NitT/TauT family transport system permease protein